MTYCDELLGVQDEACWKWAYWDSDMESNSSVVEGCSAGQAE